MRVWNNGAGSSAGQYCVDVVWGDGGGVFANRLGRRPGGQACLLMRRSIISLVPRQLRRRFWYPLIGRPQPHCCVVEDQCRCLGTCARTHFTQTEEDLVLVRGRESRSMQPRRKRRRVGERERGEWRRENRAARGAGVRIKRAAVRRRRPDVEG